MSSEMLREKKIQLCKGNLEKQRKDLMEAIDKEHCLDIFSYEREDRASVIERHLNNLFYKNEQLNDVEDALKRVGKETFGFCVDCKEDIIDRVLIGNTYKRCCSCQLEHVEKKRQNLFITKPVKKKRVSKKNSH
ncbi:hypothetical protein ACFLYY_01680 [Patescibacteria group bacterium]